MEISLGKWGDERCPYVLRRVSKSSQIKKKTGKKRNGKGLHERARAPLVSGTHGNMRPRVITSTHTHTPLRRTRVQMTLARLFFTTFFFFYINDTPTVSLSTSRAPSIHTGSFPTTVTPLHRSRARAPPPPPCNRFAGNV